MSVQVTPDNTHPLPGTLTDRRAESLQENARIAAGTATLMAELGMPFEMTEADEEIARKLFQEVDKKRVKTKSHRKQPSEDEINPPQLYTGNVALKLAALLTDYDHRVVLDATQARTYITNRLLEISKCGDAKYELRALELFGKMSDIGAFSEKSEITITHRTSDDLKQAIQEKIERLLGGTVVEGSAKTLEEELDLVEKVEDAEVVEEQAPEVDPEPTPSPET